MEVTLSDSDALVDWLKRKEPGFSTVDQLIRAELLLTTTVSRFEIYTGVRDAEERAQADGLFQLVETRQLTDDAAERAAWLNRLLRLAGNPLPIGDLLIAGIALTLGLPLLTRNVRHFSRVPGLVVVTP